MRGDYLAKLSQAARWYLPQAEAAEVVEDYRDLIQQEPRSEEELLRDLGSPWSAARQLVQPRAYRRWVAVFAVLDIAMFLFLFLPVSPFKLRTEFTLPLCGNNIDQQRKNTVVYILRIPHAKNPVQHRTDSHRIQYRFDDHTAADSADRSHDGCKKTYDKKEE